jgi:CBS domain-containing protein
MIICPDCGHQNIPGADECEECQQSLSPLSKPKPRTNVEKGLLQDTIDQLDPRTPLTVAPSTPVGQVLQTLVDNAVGCALIVENNEVIGIFSERDALLRLNVDAQKLKDRPVSDFMTPAPETLQATNKIAFAVQKMDLKGFRHIPILCEGRATGIISIRDILRYLTEKAYVED